MRDSTNWASLMLVLLLLWPCYNLVLAIFTWWRPRPAAISDHNGNSVPFWIVVPALNEERVVAATVRAALALEEPRTPVRVLVVDDGSDDRTPEVLATIDDPRLYVLRREPPNARKGKGEALNAAYTFIRDTARREGIFDRLIVGVIDGDGRGVSGMLGEVASYFADPAVGGVQSRVRIHNRDRLLAFLQDLEFSCIANASQILRDSVGSAELGGNGQFVRLRSLATLGDAPWSSCLVEDLELGLRMHLAGHRIRYASKATITQQGLVDVSRMVRQRARWAQGNLQCLRYVPKLIGTPTVSSLALLEFLYYLLAPWLIAPVSLLVLGLAALTAAGLATGYDFDGFVATGPSGPLSIAIWLAALIFPGVVWGLVHRIQNADEPLGRTLLVGLAYGFLVIGIAATWRALGRHLTGRNSWAKTERLVEEDDKDVGNEGNAVSCAESSVT
ncbi:glycosyltransferase family 2 protein [Fodinicola feengrottensis]|uniref:glycosyltransferase family 2 protein n=1 Tax=Fodinicola feengrottensis TaxID=435914 RepID=UPI002442D594|nr:glycosyltransferase [Fodinicola feengrottensis]